MLTTSFGRQPVSNSSVSTRKQSSAVEVTHRRLQEDETLEERTPLLLGSITELLELCLRMTYFSFKGKFYEQSEGAAMGSPVSAVVGIWSISNSWHCSLLHRDPEAILLELAFLWVPNGQCQEPFLSSSHSLVESQPLSSSWLITLSAWVCKFFYPFIMLSP